MSLVRKGENVNRCLKDDEGSAVIVAVKASREISRCALAWALTNVVQSGDSVRLLVVLPAHQHHGKTKIPFSGFHSDSTLLDFLQKML